MGPGACGYGNDGEENSPVRGAKKDGHSDPVGVPLQGMRNGSGGITRPGGARGSLARLVGRPTPRWCSCRVRGRRAGGVVCRRKGKSADRSGVRLRDCRRTRDTSHREEKISGLTYHARIRLESENSSTESLRCWAAQEEKASGLNGLCRFCESGLKA